MPTTRIHDLVTIASKLSRISVDDILGPSKKRPIARVRQAIMYAATLQGVHSFPQIGRVMRRDHTTVVHAKQMVPEFMARDPEYLKFVWAILAKAAQSDQFLNRRDVRFEFADLGPDASA